MKFFVVLSALTTLATASLFGGKTFNLQDDGSLIVGSDIGKRMMITKPMGWNEGLQGNGIWTNRLGIQQTTPNMIGIEGLSGMDRTPWWMCRDSTCLHQMILKRTPVMMDTMMLRTPNMVDMHTVTGMGYMPWWMCKDRTCFNQMMSQMTPTMMQNMPMMNMWMHPMMANSHMTPVMIGNRMMPMMHLEDIRPTEMHSTGRFMTMGQDFPLEDTRIMTGDMTPRNNFWNMYMNNMDTLGHQMRAQRLMNDELVF